MGDKVASTFRIIKWASIGTLAVLMGILVFVLMFDSLVGDLDMQDKVADRSLKNFQFVCSKKGGDGKIINYFESFTHKPGSELSLPQKITDVTVSVSKIKSSGGWDVESLCGVNSTLDLAKSDWGVLVPGKDCGFGARIEPCDLRFKSDNVGVYGIIFGPEVNGYITKTIGDYLRQGTLIKIEGKIKS